MIDCRKSRNTTKLAAQKPCKYRISIENLGFENESPNHHEVGQSDVIRSRLMNIIRCQKFAYALVAGFEFGGGRAVIAMG
jgi:hypothetical protein